MYPITNKLTKKDAVKYRKTCKWMCSHCGYNLRPIHDDNVKRSMHIKCEKEWMQMKGCIYFN